MMDAKNLYSPFWLQVEIHSLHGREQCKKKISGISIIIFVLFCLENVAEPASVKISKTE